MLGMLRGTLIDHTGSTVGSSEEKCQRTSLTTITTMSTLPNIETAEAVTPPSKPSLVLPSSPTSTSLIYQAYHGPEISDETLQQCSELFSNNYGIWGQTPDGKGPKPGLCSMVYSLAIRLTEISGNRVKLSTSKLRKQLLSVPQNTVLVVCYQPEEGGWLELVGHAFATAWDYDGGKPILKINCYCSNPFVVRPCRLGHTACRQPLYSQTVHRNIPPPNVEVACSLP